MLFNSFQYIIFLPIVFCLYWFVFKPLKWQNLLVLVCSYVFYGWWDWRFLILIAITTGLSWLSGIAIEGAEGIKRRKWILAGNISVNLLILGVFKYYNFFASSLSEMVSVFGYQLDMVTLQVVLPVGISFYTFQALSYSIDVYRKEIAATRDVIAFASFISFFPQLVAGPIEKASDLLPQFLHSRRFDYDEARAGLRQMLWGFFKKLIIADNCAALANAVFDDYAACNSSLLLLGAIFFTFQIYGDFSGYSDIALGTSKLFGIHLHPNFNLPYFSRDIREFWQRWHISLNRWFIQYVYIPLGGSRCATSKIMRNTLIVFALSGLWHGANWTFVAWGLYNGLLLCVLTLIGQKTKREDLGQISFLPSFKTSFQMLGTFCLVVIGWVLFRSNTLADAVSYFGHFASCTFRLPNYRDVGIQTIQLCFTLVFIVMLQLVEWNHRGEEFPFTLSGVRFVAFRWMIYALLILSFCIFAGSQQQFIYFQF